MSPLLALVPVLVLAGPPTEPEVLDAARAAREQAARTDGHAPVFTNRDLRRPYEAVAMAVAIATSAAVPPEDVIGMAGGGAQAEATPVPVPAPSTTPAVRAAAADEPYEPPHDEKFWRERMAGANQRIARLQSDLDYTTKQILVQRMNFVNPVGPDAGRDSVPQLNTLLEKQSQLQAELERARQDPARIREEARREGALPGWFR